VFTGLEAMKQARYDKLCEANPHRVARMELKQKMLSMVTAQALADRWKSAQIFEGIFLSIYTKVQVIELVNIL
jgi:hypothetical protein